MNPHEIWGKDRNRGFTLTELLVTITIVIILLGLLLVGISKAYARAQRLNCLNNLRNLQMGWQMFATDHEGALPCCEGIFIEDEWRTREGCWVLGSTAADGSPETIKRGTLFPYVGNLKSYRCPSDKALLKNSTEYRLRSYSLNVYLCVAWQGTDPKRNISEIQSPARTFVFIDESAATINDGAFAPEPPPLLAWNDLPADRHDQSGALSFADGHVENWKWLWPKKDGGGRLPANDKDAKDAARLRDALGF